MGAIDFQTGRTAQRLEHDHDELAERIARILPKDGVAEPIKGLYLARESESLKKLHSVVEPSFCVIAQGSKEVLLGDCRYLYDTSHYLLTTLELPRVSQVLEASKERPYLSLRLVLEPQTVSSVMVEAGHFVPARNAEDARAIDVSFLDAALLDAVVRLVRLVDTPLEAPILAPLITREIVYRLLRSEQGGRLLHLTLMGGYTTAIARAIRHIRENFDQALRVEQLAQELGMGVSGFHHHFKAVTALSPLQFLKQIRLQEARRLMLSENFDASSAAYRVGYNDAAHFNKEYKSLFGKPPIRDVQEQRETASLTS